MIKYFITGTDTDVGKTFITCKLLEYANNINKESIALKPIASGCEWINNSLVNDDVLKLHKSTSINIPYDEINFYVFKDPVSPDIAARLNGTTILAKEVTDKCRTVINKHQDNVDYCFIEGVGGWQVPINDKEYMSDIVISLDIPVMLVVSIELGSINHALLSIRAMRADNVSIVGWIANIKSGSYSDLYRYENVATIEKHIDIPLLAIYEQESLVYDKLKSVIF